MVCSMRMRKSRSGRGRGTSGWVSLKVLLPLVSAITQANCCHVRVERAKSVGPGIPALAAVIKIINYARQASRPTKRPAKFTPSAISQILRRRPPRHAVHIMPLSQATLRCSLKVRNIVTYWQKLTKRETVFAYWSGSQLLSFPPRRLLVKYSHLSSNCRHTHTHTYTMHLRRANNARNGYFFAADAPRCKRKIWISTECWFEFRTATFAVSLILWSPNIGEHRWFRSHAVSALLEVRPLLISTSLTRYLLVIWKMYAEYRSMSQHDHETFLDAVP